jgi:hypothetical protein
MNKKFFGVLLACVAVFGLTSCDIKEGKPVYVLSPEVLEKVYEEYEFVGDFHEGLAVVSKETKNEYEFIWGHINTEGDLVTKLNYTSAGRFSDGMAVVSEEKTVKEDGVERKETVYGYVNNEGEEVIKPEYEKAGEFGDGLAVVTKDEKTIIIDKTGKEVYTLSKDYNISDDAKYYDGLIPAKKYMKDGDKWGYLDKEGNEATEFVYDEADSFDEKLGYAHVVLHGHQVFIDTKEQKHSYFDVEEEFKKAYKWFR